MNESTCTKVACAKVAGGDGGLLRATCVGGGLAPNENAAEPVARSYVRGCR